MSKDDRVVHPFCPLKPKTLKQAENNSAPVAVGFSWSWFPELLCQ